VAYSVIAEENDIAGIATTLDALTVDDVGNEVLAALAEEMTEEEAALVGDVIAMTNAPDPIDRPVATTTTAAMTTPVVQSTTSMDVVNHRPHGRTIRWRKDGLAGH
jgi:hypothetical protein